MTETESVFCAVRTALLNVIQVNLSCRKLFFCSPAKLQRVKKDVAIYCAEYVFNNSVA
jgi:hypothetical protein